VRTRERRKRRERESRVELQSGTCRFTRVTNALSLSRRYRSTSVGSVATGSPVTSAGPLTRAGQLARSWPSWRGIDVAGARTDGIDAATRVGTASAANWDRECRTRANTRQPRRRPEFSCVVPPCLSDRRDGGTHTRSPRHTGSFRSSERRAANRDHRLAFFSQQVRIERPRDRARLLLCLSLRICPSDRARLDEAVEIGFNSWSLSLHPFASISRSSLHRRESN